MLFLITIAYMGYKVSLFQAKTHVDILSAVNEEHFDSSYKFGAKQGLNIAVAVFNPFAPRADPIIDPTYGRLRFSKFRWWPNDKGAFSMKMTELEPHTCSSEELGLSGSDHKFLPMKNHKRAVLEQFQSYFFCVDAEELEVYGTIGSFEGQVIDVDIVKCTGDVNCKSDEEIKTYFGSQNIHILKNQIRFDQSKYGPEAIILETENDTIAIGQWRNRLSFFVSKTDLSLQDLAVNLDEITELQDSSVFTLERGSVRPYYRDTDLVEGIRIWMNLNLTAIDRSGYTVLDILSDVGGLKSILIPTISFLIGILNYN